MTVQLTAHRGGGGGKRKIPGLFSEYYPSMAMNVSSGDAARSDAGRRSGHGVNMEATCDEMRTLVGRRISWGMVFYSFNWQIINTVDANLKSYHN